MLLRSESEIIWNPEQLEFLFLKFPFIFSIEEMVVNM